MNKQELIKIYEDTSCTLISIKGVLKDLRQLDEPQKVTIPQFVAEWINSVKTNGLKFKNTYGFYERIEPSDDVYRVIYYIFKESIANKEIRFWVGENTDTFARAWLDGYEVEEEKRYLVKMRDLETGFNLLNRHKTENYWIFSSKDESVTYQVCHTRKELEEDGWGWVFDCPGMEVEEVTE